MLFGTQKEREYYFERIALDPDSVSYGSSMYHARSHKLGLWGDLAEFMADCAKIMAAEVTNFIAIELRTDVRVSWQEIMGCGSFRNAFELARRPRSAGLENFVRSLGDNHTHMKERNEDLSYGENLTVSKAHEAVATEIVEMKRAEYRDGRLW